MDEKTFLSAAGVTVTSTRIEIGGQTFATRNVGSVKVIKPGMSWFAVLLAVIGLVSIAGSPIFGGCLLAIGVIWAYVTATKRKLVLVAGGGEVVALESGNGQQVETVRAAIAEAISVR